MLSVTGKKGEEDKIIGIALLFILFYLINLNISTVPSLQVEIEDPWVRLQDAGQGKQQQQQRRAAVGQT